MHHCLTVIVEILHEIFTDFRKTHDSRALAMLARTCQVFSDKIRFTFTTIKYIGKGILQPQLSTFCGVIKFHLGLSFNACLEIYGQQYGRRRTEMVRSGNYLRIKIAW